jgi:hypothetical protein
MFVRLWFLLTVLLSALLLGTTFAHVLEMPAKLHYNGIEWMRLQDTLYVAFAKIGGAVEIGAIVAAGVLAFMLRENRAALMLSLFGGLCLAVAFFGIWIFITNVANAEVAKWTPQSIPTDWSQWRRRWDYSHAVRFVLQLVALGALISALLVTNAPRSA